MGEQSSVQANWKKMEDFIMDTVPLFMRGIPKHWTSDDLKNWLTFDQKMPVVHAIVFDNHPQIWPGLNFTYSCPSGSGAVIMESVAAQNKLLATSEDNNFAPLNCPKFMVDVLRDPTMITEAEENFKLESIKGESFQIMKRQARDDELQANRILFEQRRQELERFKKYEVDREPHPDFVFRDMISEWNVVDAVDQWIFRKYLTQQQVLPQPIQDGNPILPLLYPNRPRDDGFRFYPSIDQHTEIIGLDELVPIHLHGIPTYWKSDELSKWLACQHGLKTSYAYVISHLPEVVPGVQFLWPCPKGNGIVLMSSLAAQNKLAFASIDKAFPPQFCKKIVVSRLRNPEMIEKTLNCMELENGQRGSYYHSLHEARDVKLQANAHLLSNRLDEYQKFENLGIMKEAHPNYIWRECIDQWSVRDRVDETIFLKYLDPLPFWAQQLHRGNGTELAVAQYRAMVNRFDEDFQSDVVPEWLQPNRKKDEESSHDDLQPLAPTSDQEIEAEPIPSTSRVNLEFDLADEEIRCK